MKTISKATAGGVTVTIEIDEQRGDCWPQYEELTAAVFGGAATVTHAGRVAYAIDTRNDRDTFVRLYTLLCTELGVNATDERAAVQAIRQLQQQANTAKQIDKTQEGVERGYANRYWSLMAALGENMHDDALAAIANLRKAPRRRTRA